MLLTSALSQCIHVPLYSHSSHTAIGVLAWAGRAPQCLGESLLGQVLAPLAHYKQPIVLSELRLVIAPLFLLCLCCHTSKLSVSVPLPQYHPILMSCFFNKLAVVYSWLSHPSLPILRVVVALEHALVKRARRLPSLLLHPALPVRPPVEKSA